MPDNTFVTAERDCDGYVVVHRWKNAASHHVGRCFDEYARLADAVAFFRGIGGGIYADHEPIGIFASKGGMPVPGIEPLDMATINAVIPGRARNDIGRVYVPNSPEQCQARQRRRAQEAQLITELERGT